MFCVDEQMAILQSLLMLEQQIVHGPKPTLGIGRFRGFCGLLSERMFMNQWEMAKDEPQTICESSPKSFDDGICTAAIGTFEIAVSYNRDGCSIGSRDMVIVLDGKRRIGIDRRLAHMRSLLASATTTCC